MKKKRPKKSVPPILDAKTVATSSEAEIEVFYAVDSPVHRKAADGYFDAPIVGIFFGHNQQGHLLCNGPRDQLVSRLKELMGTLPSGVIAVVAHNCAGADETPESWAQGMTDALGAEFGSRLKHWDGRICRS